MNPITLLAVVVAVVSLIEWQLCRISVMTFVWYLTEKGFPGDGRRTRRTICRKLIWAGMRRGRR